MACLTTMAEERASLQDDPILPVPISVIGDIVAPVSEPFSLVASEPLYTTFSSREKVMIVVLGSGATLLSLFTANIYVSLADR